jgi:hypothetical protein
MRRVLRSSVACFAPPSSNPRHFEEPGIICSCKFIKYRHCLRPHMILDIHCAKLRDLKWYKNASET